MNKNGEYTLYSIGFVRETQGNFMLEIDEAYRPGLKELDGFSHLNILWCCHHLMQNENRSVMLCKHPYASGPAQIGVFATRSPRRPNPIALTPVSVLGIDFSEGRIHIPFIDAEPGTPILDIKPYHPSLDRVRDVSVPAWCRHWPKWYEDSADFDWAAEIREQ